jgi:hypothetical protein
MGTTAQGRLFALHVGFVQDLALGVGSGHKNFIK